jgi:uncharacterized protein (UPF0261 family)
MARERQIVILATLDTKGSEAEFTAQCVRECGCTPWLLDTGIAGEATIAADTDREAVCAAAGLTAAERQALSKDDAMRSTGEGAGRIVIEMLERGEAHGVLGIGGGAGTWLSTAVMRRLPIGFPKLMVSTIAAKGIRGYVGGSDITMMPSIVDVAGLNKILKPILGNAAAAVCGMASRPPSEEEQSGPAIAMTMFGVTTAGGTLARRFLEDAGFEVVTFHANGVGGTSMEELAADGRFAGVLDWTTSELTDEVVGGRASAGPHRLEAAAAHGVPQVVVPGAIDVVNLGPREEVPDKFRERTLYGHLPTSTLMRTSAEESEAIGALIGLKLSAARGSVVVMIPQRGFSSLDVAGGPFESAEADLAFVGALRAALRADIEIEELPLHINDEAFAEAVAIRMVSLCRAAVG